MLTTNDRSDVLELPEVIETEPPPSPPKAPWGFSWLSWVVVLFVLAAGAALLVYDLTRSDDLVTPALSEISPYENPEVFGLAAAGEFGVSVAADLVAPALSVISSYENPELFGLGAQSLPALWRTTR